MSRTDKLQAGVDMNVEIAIAFFGYRWMYKEDREELLSPSVHTYALGTGWSFGCNPQPATSFAGEAHDYSADWEEMSNLVKVLKNQGYTVRMEIEQDSCYCELTGAGYGYGYVEGDMLPLAVCKAALAAVEKAQP